MDAPGLVLSPAATVGRDVRFGAHVVVHEGVVLGDGCVVQDHAVLGKPPARGAHAGADMPGLVLGAGVSVGAAAVVFTGTTIGDGAVGGETLVGRGTTVDNDVRVGARVSIQTGVYLTAWSVVEDDAFLGPSVTTTNDDTMARHERGRALRGATLRRACRVGGGTVLVPG